MENFPHDRILSKHDAKTVEVIHTNAGTCGVDENIGHIDFYPNGGSDQPGCIFNICSHIRAYKLYAESINNETRFYGRQCSNLRSAKTGKCSGKLLKMGGLKFEKSDLEGIFYFET